MADTRDGLASRSTIPVDASDRDSLEATAYPAVHALDRAEVLVRDELAERQSAPYPSARWRELLGYFDRPDYLTTAVEEWAVAVGLLRDDQVSIKLGESYRADRIATRQVLRWLEGPWVGQPVGVQLSRWGSSNLRVTLLFEDGGQASTEVTVRHTSLPGRSAMHYFAADFIAAEASRLEDKLEQAPRRLASIAGRLRVLTDTARQIAGQLLREAGSSQRQDLLPAAGHPAAPAGGDTGQDVSWGFAPQLATATDTSDTSAAAPWLVVHSADISSRRAAAEIAQSLAELPSLQMQTAAAALDDAGCYPSLVIILPLGPESTTTQERDLLHDLLLQYRKLRPMGARQIGLEGTDFHNLGIVQAVGRQDQLAESHWQPVLDLVCAVHDANELNLLEVYRSSAGLARTTRPSTAMGRVVTDAWTVLAQWGLDSREDATRVLHVFHHLQHVLDGNVAKYALHRPLRAEGGTALDFVLQGRYPWLLEQYRDARARTALQQNVARMARTLVVPTLQQQIPHLCRPSRLYVRELFRLYSSAAVVASCGLTPPGR